MQFFKRVKDARDQKLGRTLRHPDGYEMTHEAGVPKRLAWGDEAKDSGARGVSFGGDETRAAEDTDPIWTFRPPAASIARLEAAAPPTESDEEEKEKKSKACVVM
eukprot:COSAG01_NODE_14945_length_1393_cov_0.895672_1_plen_105_part_00